MPLTDLDLLRRLVAIDSTSAVSNLPIADFIADYLGAPSTEYLRDTVSGRPARQLPGVPPGNTTTAARDEPRLAGETPAHHVDKTNLLIRFGPDADGGLILSGHMDAVPAKETTWESDPFTLTERDDRYVGRGAADMKGFLAVSMNAALDAGKLRKPLYLLFTYDEEVGTLGAKQFAETYKGPLPKHCIIGEPTSFRPVRAHKGHLKLRITTTGKSAHSGYPHLGDNAIEKARPVLDGLVALRRELEAEKTEHEELFADAPYVPLNIATIRGGTAVNIVPDRCEIEVGIRLLPGMSMEEMLARVPGVVEVISNSPPLLTSRDSALYQAVLPHARQGVESVSFASDAGWLQTLGIECLLWGPGAIEVAHKANEFTPKDEFHRAGGILRELIARFCA